jgi:hypothetical protein
MSAVWKTKFGPRRVRHDPPTLQEAIVAASGLTDDLQEQTEIAASLMGMPADQVRAEVVKAAAQRKSTQTVALTTRTGAPRSVVVERKSSRPSLRTRSTAR